MPKKLCPSVSIDLARIVIRYASDIGMDADDLWRRCGLETLPEGDDRLPATLFDRVWQEVEAKSGEAVFGLRLGQAAWGYAGGHLLLAIVMNSPTVAEALGKFCRYHAILSDVVQPRLSGAASSPAIRLSSPSASVRLGLGQEAFLFSFFASILQNLTGRGGSLRHVRFANAAPKEASALRTFFGCPVRFGCRESALLLNAEMLGRPVFLAKPELLAGFERMACRLIGRLSTENSVRHKAESAIGRLLAHGDKPSLGAVAKVLAMSPRRLQQKLQSEQTGYREVLDHVRKESAMGLLLNPDTTISEITFILGFSDQSSFTHAFQSWTGITPANYRKTVR